MIRMKSKPKSKRPQDSTQAFLIQLITVGLHGMFPNDPDSVLQVLKSVSRDLRRDASLKPPEGYDSWLRYAVATMNCRALLNDHRFGHQKHWPKRVTDAQMRAAALAELDVTRDFLREMEQVWTAKTTGRGKSRAKILKR
jgi:hypothetical protein